MDTENMIEVTDAPLIELVKAAYDLSVPQGLGFLHAESGSLSDEDAEALITEEGRIAVRMDYVKGRACKMTVFRESASPKMFIRNKWFDHSESQLQELLERCGIEQ